MLLLCFLFFLLITNSCQPPKNKLSTPPNFTTSNPSEQGILLDTLVFEPFMAGEELEAFFAYSQDFLAFYQDFVRPKQIGQHQIFKDRYSQSNIHYLGQWKDLTLNARYHVITDFKLIGSGNRLPPKGRSKLVLLNTQTDAILLYDMARPNNLPLRLADNILYFELEPDQHTGLSISGGLPPLFCVPKGVCFGG